MSGLRVFSISQGQDTGGWAWRIKTAFDHCAPDWEMRSMVATRNFIGFPIDLYHDQAKLDELYDRADVIHLHNYPMGHDAYDAGQGKPTIVQYHGTAFRQAHADYAPQAARIGAVQISSTVDLTLLEPDVIWTPLPQDLAALRAVRTREYVASERIRIVHSPTDRRVKSTGAFLATMHELGQRYPIDVIIIEGQPWTRCQELKAQGDIFYDQLHLGYGGAAVEAWAMGMPVVAGVADPAVRAAMVERWGRIPFAEPTKNLTATFERLIADRACRAEWAAIGTEHVERWHEEGRAAAILQDIYRAAQPTTPGRGRRRLSRPVVRPGHLATRQGLPA
jgi:hypothetical protein